MPLPQQFNTERVSHFVITPEFSVKKDTDGPTTGQYRPAFGSISFRGYTDKTGVFGASGREVQYVISRDDKGRPKGKWFTLSQSHNAFKVNDTDQDTEGKSMYKFIANSPWCEGSENGTYIRDEKGNRIQLDVRYRLMDSEADAEVALIAGQKRAKAQNSVLELDDQTLLEIATIGTGYRGSEKMMRHKVFEWAGIKPDDYNAVLESGDRPYRALIRRGINDKILSLKGEIIYWEATVLGANEDIAVQVLLQDKTLLDALKEKIKIEFSEPEKKKAGRPPKTEKK